MKRWIKTLAGHKISRDRIIDVYTTFDKKKKEERVKIAISKLGVCGHKTIFLVKGSRLSEGEKKKIYNLIFDFDSVEIVDEDAIKNIIYRRRR